ncbi:MAG: type II secretion system protein [Candidatus Vogelbacteria bacterium]|nr:type II secretion system protein [Candidatus Vogelbacteria bacterium]
MMKKGFTLIELLVVIAIIGILSSVVLTQLGNARKKGADAGIMANIGSMRTQFEIDYDSTQTNVYGTAGTDCGAGKFAAGVYQKALERIVGLNGGSVTSASNSRVVCVVTNNAWMVAAWLGSSASTGNPTYYCTDSNGAAGVKTAEFPATSVSACPS